MRRDVASSLGMLLILSSLLPGCVSSDPTPLSSNPHHQLGLASLTFHRDSTEVADATREAIRDLSFTLVRQRDTGSLWDFEYEAMTSDGREVLVTIAMTRGRAEGDTLSLLGLISKVTVRVGRHGDRELSDQLLERISVHLRRIPTPGD